MRVVGTGRQRVVSVTIDAAAVDPADVGMLEDLVLAAVTEALDKSQSLAGERLGAITGGVKLPGM